MTEPRATQTTEHPVTGQPVSIPATNGKPPILSLEKLLALSEVNTASRTGEEARALIDILLDEMSQATRPQDLKVWLVENATRCAKLTDKDQRKRVEDKAIAAGVDRAFVNKTWANLLELEVKREKPGSEHLRYLLYGRLGYTFALNVCTREIMIGDRPIDDGAASKIRVQMRDLGEDVEKRYEDIYTSDASANSFHPVKRYLESVSWDGKDHIAELAGYIRDEHTPIVYADGTSRTVIHAWLYRWLIGAVARVYEEAQNPMIILAGKQGDGKSTLVKWLGRVKPIEDMYCEEQLNLDDPDHNRNLASVWVWEASEFGKTMRKADREAIKNFITKHRVRFRVPYAKHPVTVPTITSFIGTVNPEGDGLLTDPTGNRRFQMVDIASIDWRYSVALDVNQVWAQALHLYRSGEQWTLTEEERRQRERNNEAHMRADTVEDAMLYLFDIDPSKENSPGWELTSIQIIDALRNKAGLRDSDASLLAKIGIAAKKIGAIKKERPRRFAGIKPKGVDPNFADM